MEDHPKAVQSLTRILVMLIRSLHTGRWLGELTQSCYLERQCDAYITKNIGLLTSHFARYKAPGTWKAFYLDRSLQLNLTRLAVGLALLDTAVTPGKSWVSSSLSVCSPESVSDSGNSWSRRPHPAQKRQCRLTFLLQSTQWRQNGDHRARTCTTGRDASLDILKHRDVLQQKKKQESWLRKLNTQTDIW